jgi:6-phosphogluconolactonase
VFWGDERAVPFEDTRNNAKMAFDSLLNFVTVPPGQIHVMRTDIPPEQSAAEYEKILRQYFPIAGRDAAVQDAIAAPANSFDLVLLGMGDDGHTLSLFPGTAVIHEEQAWAKAYFLTSQDMYRITLTKTIVNRSARIAFLTTGTAKAHALREVLRGLYNPDLYPSQEIKPENGELHWFVDEAAAQDL